MKEKELLYFKKRQKQNDLKFFNRFPSFDFSGKTILDFGCGHGSLSIDLALRGAYKVLGVDIDPKRIQFAKENLAVNYAHLNDVVEFKCVNVELIQNNYFDYIFSYAVFEHIINLDKSLSELKNKLKIGGKIITGFGPLYNSPWGDHNLSPIKLPWFHLIIGKKKLINNINKKRKKKLKHIYDAGLNGYSLKKILSILYNTNGLSVINLRTNVSYSPLAYLFKLLAIMPFLKEFFTFNIYCILKRTH
ncbi:MAG: class I SAM-dependent methyltransferase [bacterium]